MVATLGRDCLSDDPQPLGLLHICPKAFSITSDADPTSSIFNPISSCLDLPLCLFPELDAWS